jgi:hypothetical protein
MFVLTADKHAYAGQLNSSTHLRALLVLHFPGILAQGIWSTSRALSGVEQFSGPAQA